MAAFVDLKEAEDYARDKMDDKTYVVAHSALNKSGAPIVRALNTVANGGGWVEITGT